MLHELQQIRMLSLIAKVWQAVILHLV